MHVSDLPENPLWLLLSGSDHISGLLAIVFVAAAVYALWRTEKIEPLLMLGAAVVFGLTAYELATFGEINLFLGPVPVAAVLMGIAAVVGAAAVARSAWNQQLRTMLKFISMTLAALALFAEILSMNNGALDVINVVWWISIVTGLVSAALSLQRSTNQKGGSKLAGDSANGG